jgi:16S rRNA (cytosine1402-N4)-methyltransferase
MEHIPVLAGEVIKYLSVKVDDNSTYVDCTVGGGGHAHKILERMGGKGHLVAIDWDDSALERARDVLVGATWQIAPTRRVASTKVHLVRDDYRNIRRVLGDLGIDRVDGFLFDLGLSSFQLDSSERGFSLRHDGPLDMRMDRRKEVDARRLINTLSKDELGHILKAYGEEPYAKRIADLIVRERRKRKISSTGQLVDIIGRALPDGYRRGRLHFATRSFQALRIAVNDELAPLKEALLEAISFLKEGGRIVVISFHSLEDRIVKRAFGLASGKCSCPPGLPECNCGRRKIIRVLTAKPVRPSAYEVSLNPRSRSARLRAGEKMDW